jgi:ERCC4-type nuclease
MPEINEIRNYADFINSKLQNKLHRPKRKMRQNYNKNILLNFI